MINQLSELDIAELKHMMRGIYREGGYDRAMQCLYEIVKAGEILTEVMVEELRKEHKPNEPV